MRKDKTPCIYCGKPLPINMETKAGVLDLNEHVECIKISDKTRRISKGALTDSELIVIHNRRVKI